MAASQTEVQAEAIDLSSEVFDTFCSDISGMFGVEMKCAQKEVCEAQTISDLKKRFKKIMAVNIIEAEGALDGSFQLILDQGGLFILSGIITMPEQMTSMLERCVRPTKILKNIKDGSLKDAQEMRDAIAEAGNLMVGAWDRIFRDGLKDHKHFRQADLFIGNPWDNPKKKIDLDDHEEFTFVLYEVTVKSYPPFHYGIVFPKLMFADAEEKAGILAEAKAKAEAETKARVEAEKEARAEVEAEAKAEAKVKFKAEAEEEAKAEAEENLKAEIEAKAKAEDKEQPQAETTEDTKPEAQAEPQAEATEETKTEAQAEPQAEATEEPKPEAQEEPKAETEEQTELGPEEEPDKDTAVEAVDNVSDAGIEEKPATTDEAVETEEQPVSKTIEKMVQSPAALPGELIAVAELLSALSAKDIMQKDVTWGSADESVQQSLTRMQQADVGYMMVGQNGTVEGIVSRSDITGAISPYLRSAFAKWRRPIDDATLQIRIKWIMSRPVRTISLDTPLATIMENMSRFGGRCLPVVDEQGKVQGLVTVFDIFKSLLKGDSNVSTAGKTPRSPLLV